MYLTKTFFKFSCITNNKNLDCFCTFCDMFETETEARNKALPPPPGKQTKKQTHQGPIHTLSNCILHIKLLCKSIFSFFTSSSLFCTFHLSVFTFFHPLHPSLSVSLTLSFPFPLRIIIPKSMHL